MKSTDPRDRWGPTEYLLADMWDLMQTHVFVTGYKGSGKKLPKMDPHSRPTDILQEMQRLAKQQQDIRDRLAGIEPDWWAGAVQQAIVTGEMDAGAVPIVARDRPTLPESKDKEE
jgi:hypothetical protein